MIELNKIYHGKHQEILKDFPENYFDSCVADPPYGISFMNQHWDYDVPTVEDWKGILRVMKPGAHLLCACGTRTQHRMVVNIEDAGFEIRDVITWHYGSGFPKSLDIGKAIDKAAGAEREIVGSRIKNTAIGGNDVMRENGKKTGAANYSASGNDERIKYENINLPITAPSTEAAKQWEGYGTALKPATEFWTLARKPLSENTVAANVLKWGTGGINIDGCRIEMENSDDGNRKRFNTSEAGNTFKYSNDFVSGGHTNGRFPANVIFDEFTGKILDEQSIKISPRVIEQGRVTTLSKKENGGFGGWAGGVETNSYTDKQGGNHGGASRFFYCPKADNYERNKGLEKFTPIKVNDGRETEIDKAFQRGETLRKNTHPTVKPIDLMRYLVKLITPKKGICLDPYCGSGTTLIGCKMELINFIGIDKVENHCRIAEARVAAWNPDKYKAQTLF